MPSIEYRNHTISYAVSDDGGLKSEFSTRGQRVFGIKMSRKNAIDKGLMGREDPTEFLVRYRKGEVNKFVPGGVVSYTH
ncbi:MAG: hypothetical protein V7742_21260 [Halioglobus sp.]